MGEFSTIVADPPWDQGGSFALTRGFAERLPGSRSIDLPYKSMELEDIASMPVSQLAARDAHLYLWTTQKYLRDSFDVADAWGFSVSATLVWCKESLGFQIGGTYASTTEFCHFCRRGNLAALSTIDTRWFKWPRKRGAPVKMGERRTEGHSAKPEAFLDMVENVSPGPYLELFARRQRLNWSTWGDQALEHVTLDSFIREGSVSNQDTRLHS